MKFKPEIPDAVLPVGTLAQDFSNAMNAGKVFLGDLCVFFPKFSGISYLPCEQILRAWLRQEEVRARMCCATANFDQFFLVLACADGKERRGQVEDKAAGQLCLDRLAAQNPAIKIGFVKPKT